MNQGAEHGNLILILPRHGQTYSTQSSSKARLLGIADTAPTPATVLKSWFYKARLAAELGV